MLIIFLYRLDVEDHHGRLNLHRHLGRLCCLGRVLLAAVPGLGRLLTHRDLLPDRVGEGLGHYIFPSMLRGVFSSHLVLDAAQEGSPLLVTHLLRRLPRLLHNLGRTFGSGARRQLIVIESRDEG